MKKISLFILSFLFLLSCKLEEDKRLLVYRYPMEGDIGVVVTEYSKQFITMLVHDTISAYATYMVAPLVDDGKIILIIRSSLYSTIEKDNIDFGSIGYDIYMLNPTDGELYDCKDADYDQFYYLGKEKNDFHKISYEKNFYLDSILNFNGSSRLWYGGDTKPILVEGSCLGYFYDEKLYPPRFPSPLVRVKKINYKELGFPPAGRKNEKRLRPALEALFSGRPILEVDSLLKVGFKGINEDKYKMDTP